MNDFMNAYKECRLQEINKMMQSGIKAYNQLLDEITKSSSSSWHPHTETPDDKDAWFLAIYKGVPIITHYLESGFIPGVTHWQYIEMPMDM